MLCRRHCWLSLSAFWRSNRRSLLTPASLGIHEVGRIRKENLESDAVAVLPNVSRSIIDNPDSADLQSYRYAMDSLFESEQYEQSIDIWRQYRNRSVLARKMSNPRSLLIIFAACLYKMNTAESYRSMIDEMRRIRAENVPTPARMRAFAIGLALNQNDITMAERLLPKLCDGRLFTSLQKTLEMIVYTRVGNIDNAIGVMRSLLDIDSPVNPTMNGVANCALDELYIAIKKSASDLQRREFRQLQNELTIARLRINFSLDDLLMVPIAIQPPIQQLSIDDKEQQKIDAYKTALFDRVIERVRDDGPLEVERYLKPLTNKNKF